MSAGAGTRGRHARIWGRRTQGCASPTPRFPDIGPRSEISDAGVEGGADGGVAPADSGVDAGVDAGVDGASRERPLVARATVRGPSRIPAGAHLALRLDMERVRTSSVANEVRQLLGAIPEWQELVGGSGIDALNDLDRVLIATPNRFTSRILIVGRHTHDEEFTRGVVARMADARDTQAPWGHPIRRAHGPLGEREPDRAHPRDAEPAAFLDLAPRRPPDRARDGPGARRTGRRRRGARGRNRARRAPVDGPGGGVEPRGRGAPELRLFGQRGRDPVTGASGDRPGRCDAASSAGPRDVPKRGS